MMSHIHVILGRMLYIRHITEEMQNITSLIVYINGFVELKCFIFKGIDWTVNVTSGGESLTNSRHKSFNSSLANLLILRGKDASIAVTGK